MTLYRKMLDDSDAKTVGDALMETRKALAEANAGVSVWAATVIWGNPWGRLVRQKGSGSKSH